MTVIAHDDIIISLPELSGGRPRARALVDGLGDELRDSTLVLDCRQMVAGSQSFADELVRQVLVNTPRARALRVEFAPELFDKYLMDAAKDHGVGDRLILA